MAQTISFSKGRIAPLHDMRIGQLPDNVDPSLIHQDCVIIDKLAEFNYDIECYTNAKFQPYLDAYNERQTREDRKKKKTYVEIFKEENEKLLKRAEENKKAGKKTAVRKPTPIACEYVMQFGNHETNGTSDTNVDIEKNKYAAFCFLEEFQKRYKHIEVLLATFHADEPEGTPHLHMIVQFEGEGYKQGLERQISISKSLECDGFARSNNRGDYAVNRWIDEIKDTIMVDVLENVFHEDREIVGEHRKHEDVRIFRQKARDEEKALQEQREELDSYNKSQWQLLNDAHAELVTYRDRLVEQSNSLDADKSMLTTEQAEFEAYKEALLQSLHDKETSLLQYEQLGIDYLSRAKQIYNNLSREVQFKESKAGLYNKSIQSIETLHTQLDESLLPKQSPKKQHSLSL